MDHATGTWRARVATCQTDVVLQLKSLPSRAVLGVAAAAIVTATAYRAHALWRTPTKLAVPAIPVAEPEPLVPTAPPPDSPPFERMYMSDAPAPLQDIVLYRRLAGYPVSERFAGLLHDSCIHLDGIDDDRFRSFVPELIDAIDAMPRGLCTRTHCIDALVHLTGVNKGPRARDWRTWWATQPAPPAPDFPDLALELDRDVYTWRVTYDTVSLVLDAEGRFQRVERLQGPIAPPR